MTRLCRFAALAVLGGLAAASLGAGLVARHSYSEQFREHANAAPGARFPLGTDSLGRDRFSRLLHGSRVSLLLAPAAALLSVALAAAAGLGAALGGSWARRLLMAGADLFLSLPWLFLLLTVRAVLPLNVDPAVSIAITFALLGALGWPATARIVCTAAGQMLSAAWFTQALAAGCRRRRLLLTHLLPGMRPVLAAQFWLLVPAYLLSEANLGLLGLGITEPLPSWGGLLRELESLPLVAEQPWVLTPAVLLLAATASLQVLLTGKERTS
jgi:ABC-type dipeptide/oligopeptide/nickel transport system permease subunit